MISHLKGTVIDKSGRHIVLNVGGIGYKVAATTETLEKAKLGAEISLWTHLIVREDVLDLYGFIEKQDLAFFELLMTVSGIGPKSALGILNVADVKTLHKAVTTGDTSYLTKVSGIGKKTAEKIVRELQEKVGALDGKESGGSAQGEVDSIEALQALGYSREEARDALKKIDPSITDTGARVKAALKSLGKKS